MKGSATTDRRVARTHRLLRDALIALILEKGWDELSVQDVCDRADVGRSTFYTHFADREDLLLSGFANLKQALRASAVLGDARAGLGFSRGLLQHADENRRLFRALIGKRTGLVVMRRFRQLVLELTEEELSSSLSGQTLALTTAWVTGGFIEVLTWWLDARPTVDVAVADDAIQRLVRRALRP